MKNLLFTNKASYFLACFLILGTTLSAMIHQTNAGDAETDLISEYSTVFRDDFDGTEIDSQIWEVYTNGGTVNLNSGWITLSIPDESNIFPYIHTKYNLIPAAGDFSIKIGFQYLSVTTHGNGFSVDDWLPANGSSGATAWQPTIYSIWQDIGLGYQIFDYSGNSRYFLSAPHLDFHEIEIRWLDNTDEYYIDGQLVNSIPRDNNVQRPKSIWFGNPVVTGTSREWTSFRIDYIEIGSLEGPTPFDLPVNYPGRGNPSIEQFNQAWDLCTKAFFDHDLPGAKGDNGNGFLLTFSGHKLPGTIDNCTLGETCYDGHEGYDFDDMSCFGSAVFPVASGEIVSDKTGWFDDGYGNRVVIQHDITGYKTLYGHLSAISVSSGYVSQNTKIGEIGNTGCPGCGTHLHLNVYYNDVLIDPSGWEPAPWYMDPYVETGNGLDSYRLWVQPSSRSTPVIDTRGTNLISPSGKTIVSISPNAYGEDYELKIIDLAPLYLPDHLLNAGNSFLLSAQNRIGENITSLDEEISFQVQFDTNNLVGINQETLSFYQWNSVENQWIPIFTTTSFSTEESSSSESNLVTITAVTNNFGYFALLGEPYLLNLPLILR